MVSGMEAEFQDEVRGKQGIHAIIHLEKPTCPVESLPPVLAKAQPEEKLVISRSQEHTIPIDPRQNAGYNESAPIDSIKR